MKWIVGLDLRRGGDGPIHFAAWLARATAVNGPADRLHGVHVLEQDAMAFAGLAGAGAAEAFLHGGPRAAEIDEHALKSTEEALTRADAASFFEEAEVARHLSAEAYLTGLAERTPHAGLIVGRRAQQGEERLVRLGRVTRRILRALPRPVIVTPPDLKPEALGEGPVVAATDTNDASVAACHYAAVFARRIGRPLLLVHAIPTPELWAPTFYPRAEYATLRDELQRKGEARLSRWAKENFLDTGEQLVVQGDVSDALTEVAADRSAPLIVCGSRRMSPVTRIFVVSMASELAAISWRPVMVVPPDHTP